MAVEYVYGLVDCQSFYVSCELAVRSEYRDRTLEDDTTDPVLIVAGSPERRSGIVLACSQTAKNLGVTNAMTLGSALNLVPNSRVISPHMSLYLQTSTAILQVLQEHFPLVEAFSVDENFIAFPLGTHLFPDVESAARKLRERIWDQFKIRVRIGLGPNKWVAKMTNNIAKKKKGGIEWWRKEEVLEKLHPLPVHSMWGLKRRADILYNQFGCNTIKDVSEIPVEKLRKRFGAWGDVIHRWSMGIDLSPINPHSYNGPQQGLSNRMTLPRGYVGDAVYVPTYELIDEVCRRARVHHQKGRRIGVSFMYEQMSGGFYKAKTIPHLIDQASDMKVYVKQLIDQYWDGTPVRAIGVSLDMLETSNSLQLSLFEDNVKKHNLSKALDEIHMRFGTTSLVRASSLTRHGQVMDRAKKIGGHYM